MTDKTVSAIKALLDIGLGAGLLIVEPNKPKKPAAKKETPRKVKPRRAGEPADHAVEVEEIGKGEYLPKPPPVSSESGFSKDAWAKVQLAKQRAVNWK